MKMCLLIPGIAALAGCGGETFPLEDLNGGHCAGNCDFRIAPGEEIVGAFAPDIVRELTCA